MKSDRSTLTLPAIRPDIAKAIETAKQNLPPYPTELCLELGAFIPEDHLRTYVWKQSKPSFWRWIWFVGGCPDGFIPNTTAENLEDGCLPEGPFDPSDIGYQGMWRGAVRDRHLIWCSLPSLRHGFAKPGATVDVGEEKLRPGYTKTDLDSLVRRGWEIMLGMIEERGEYVPASKE